MESINVLIIEDDVLLANTLRTIFECMHKIPIKISIATGRSDAVKMLNNVHAVLLDHHFFDDTEGAELLEIVKKSTDAPVVIFTGNSSPELKRQAKNNGVELYIKPDAMGALEALGKAMTSYVERTYGKTTRA